MTDGTWYDVLSVHRVIDGDSVSLYRSRLEVIDGRRRLVSHVDPELIRLVWVDTPERGQPGYREARDDLAMWLAEHLEGLRVVCYRSAGWDRVLGDLVAADGTSASQWLMIDRGWPPYAGRAS